MSPLSQEILSVVDALSEINQQQVLDFVDFLLIKQSQPIAFQPESDRSFFEMAEEDPLEYVDGVLVIKSQGRVFSGDLVNKMREDRMQDVSGW